MALSVRSRYHGPAEVFRTFLASSTGLLVSQFRQGADVAEKQGPSKRQLAVALRYNEDKEAAPRILAKGKGDVAQKILDIAKEQNIPVREDPDLVEALAKLDVGSLIPSELYPAVAEVLAFVYRQNQRYGQR